MKLRKKQKENHGKSKAQELYPKVKTFSRAYDYSSGGNSTAVAQSGISSSSLRDIEINPVPLSPLVPEYAASVDINDPERIDLQDTLLTDESFTERFPIRHQTAEDAGEDNSFVPAAEPEQYSESEESDSYETAPEEEPKLSFPAEPEAEYESDFYSGSESGPEEEGETASEKETELLFPTEPEAQYESDFYIDPESDPEEEEEAAFPETSPIDDLTASFCLPDDDSDGDEKETDPEPLSEAAEETGPDSFEQLFPRLETKGKTSLKAVWKPLENADGYDVFFARSGESFGKAYRSLSSAETALTFSELEKKTVYKMRVNAFVFSGGQKSVLCESDTVCCITGGSTKKHTNPLDIKLKKENLTLSAGEKKKISASVIGQDPEKTVLEHGGLLRYLSEDTDVASVSKEGKVTGIAPGRCRIFLIASSGLHTAVNVIVQKENQSVAFRKKKYSLAVGNTINLSKKLKSAPDGESGSLKWKSSDKKVAEVSRKGIVNALKKGQITVRVKSGENGHAKVRIRVSAAKKKNTIPWESFKAKK